MGSMSIWHWVIVALIVLLLFGKGRISEMMGDLAKGIKSFKKGLADEDMSTPDSRTPAQVTQAPSPAGQGSQPAQNQTPAGQPVQDQAPR